MMKAFAFILVLFLVYLFFALPLLGRPLLTDEVAMAQVAKSGSALLSPGPGGHPPLYIDTLRFISQFLGMRDNSLRIIGLLCFIFDLVLIYQLAKIIFKDKNTGILSCLIFALQPMAIQGSMILDIDNT